MTDKPKWWLTWWLPAGIGVPVWLVVLMFLGSLEGPSTCRDGWRSSSIGRQGACSWHGGVKRTGGWAFIGSIASGIATAYWVAKIQARLSPPPAPSPALTPSPTPTPTPTGPLKSVVTPKRVVVPAPHGETACPTCGARMIQRVAKRGKNAGNRFWGCSRFPSCSGTRNISSTT